VERQRCQIYRALAAERPAVFNSRLAGSLRVMSGILRDLGRNIDADREDREAQGLAG
jgi:hypothetical protein